jgi:hypothetical protein
VSVVPGSAVVVVGVVAVRVTGTRSFGAVEKRSCRCSECDDDDDDRRTATTTTTTRTANFESLDLSQQLADERRRRDDDDDRQRR